MQATHLLLRRRVVVDMANNESPAGTGTYYWGSEPGSDPGTEMLTSSFSHEQPVLVSSFLP